MSTFELKDSDTLEFYTDKSGEYRWRVSASNGEKIAAATEGYSSKANAQSNFERERGNDAVEMYQDKAGEYRWRARSSNGNIVAATTEGYASKASALSNLERNGYVQSQIQEAAA